VYITAALCYGQAYQGLVYRARLRRTIYRPGSKRK